MLVRIFVTVVLLLPLVGCGGSITLDLTQAELQARVDEYFPINSDDYAEEDLPARVTLSDPELLLENGSDRVGLRVKVSVEKKEGAPDLPTPPSAPPNAESDGPRPTPPGPPPGLKPPGGLPPTGPGTPETPPASPVESPPGGAKQLDPPPEKLDVTVAASGKIAYRAEEGAFYLLEPSIDEVPFQQLPSVLTEPVRKVTGQLLNKYLTENAIYTLSDEDTKTKAAKMLLKSVAVQDGKLKVELGP